MSDVASGPSLVSRFRVERKTRQQDRRLDVARLIVEGYPTREIAEKLGIAQSTVVLDGQAIRKEWARQAVELIDAKQVEHLERCLAQRKRLLDAWEASRGTKITVTRRRMVRDSQGNPVPAEVVVEETVREDGNHEYADQIAKYDLIIAKLLGVVDEKKKLDASTGAHVQTDGMTIIDVPSSDVLALPPAVARAYEAVLTGSNGNGNGHHAPEE